MNPPRPRSAIALVPLGVVGAILLCGAAAAYAQKPTAPTPEQLGFSRARLERLDRWMEGEIQAGHIAGAVVLIARDGKVAWERAFGYADIATHRPMRADTMFRLFSMTKPVTSVALLTLYEQGKFQLTDPLERYVPAFRNVGVYERTDPNGHIIVKPPSRKITIEDVFRHTAGFTYAGYIADTPVDRIYRESGVIYAKVGSLAELVQKIATMPLLYEPGGGWAYSYASDVQAYLVEQLSGLKFDEYCRKTIFEPLGMKDTVFGISPERADRYPTVYHTDASGALKAASAAEDYYTGMPVFGGVSLASTARDYLRFAQMLLNGGELDGVRILGPKTVELMRSDDLPANVNFPDWMPGMRYGLGVSVLADVAKSGNLGSKGQFGWPGLMSTWFEIDPTEKLIAIVMTQHGPPRDVRFDDEFQTLVYQALVKGAAGSAAR